jgi:hypothetical protein
MKMMMMRRRRKTMTTTSGNVAGRTKIRVKI